MNKKLLPILFSFVFSGFALAQNNALDFDGSDDFVDGSNATVFDISSDFTVEAWIYPRSQGTISTIFGKKTSGGPTNGWALYLNSWNTSDGKILLEMNNANYQTSATNVVPLNTWSHVAMAVVSGIPYLYINGVSTSWSGSTAFTSSSNNFQIGAFGDNAYTFNGKIDEVRVWNTGRSQGQIQTTMNSSLTGNESNLAAYYNFNQGIAGGTNIGLTSLAGKTATPYNAALTNFALSGNTSNWVSGSSAFNNNALQFNGNGFTGPYVNVSSNSNDFNLSTFTFEAWINPTTGSNGNQTILSKGGGNGSIDNSYIFQVQSGTLRFYNSGASASPYWYNSGISIPNDTWTHVAVSYDNTTLRFYVNGVNVYNTNVTFNLSAGTNDFFIGQQGYSCLCNKFYGQIDEVRVWNIALSQNDIKSNMNNTVSTVPSGLVASYNFNQGIGSVSNTGINSLIDGTGLHNGTLNSFTLSGSQSNWVNSASTITGIYAFAAPYVSVQPSLTICSGLSTTYTPTVTGQGSGFTYQWLRNGVALPGQTTATLTLTSALTTTAGTFSVLATSIYGTSTSSGLNLVGCNNALNFDGTDDYLFAPNIFTTAPTKFSIEFWLNPTTIYDYNQQIGGANSWGSFVFHTTSNGSVYTGTDGGNRFTPAELPSGTVQLNQWQHFAFTFNNGNANFYKNGQLLASKSIPLPNSWGGLRTAGVSGSLDKLRVWDVELSAADVLINKNKSMTGNETGLIAYYDFNEGIAEGNNSSISTLYDRTSNGNDATLYNFSLNGSTSNFIASGNTFSGVYAFAAPSITGITSSQTACPGSNASFNVTIAGGAEATYQWYKDGIAISGATTTGFSLTALTSTNAGIYAVAVQSLGGNITSSGITLDMNCINALDFDGSNDAISIPDNAALDFTSKYTFEAWIKVNNYQYSTLVSKFDDDNNQRGWMINFGESGDNRELCVVHSQLGSWTNYIQWGSGFMPDLNTWYHIAVTYDASLPSNQIKLYVNGTLNNQTTWNYTMTPNNANVYLGGYDGNGNGFNAGANSRFFNGEMDEVRLWNVARTQPQIQTAMSAQLTTTLPGLVAEYKFNQGNAGNDNTGITTAVDATSNNLTGTLSNFALNGNASNWVAGTVSGAYIAPKINLKGNGIDIVEGVSATTTTGTYFGTTIDGVSITRTFTIENNGAIALTVSSVNITGVAAGEFSIISAPGTTVSVGGSTTFKVKFISTTATSGFRVATINVLSTDYDNSNYSFEVSAFTIPVAPQAVTASSSSICLGTSTNLSATSSGNNINWYTVSVGGTTLGTSASMANFTVSPGAVTTYYAEAQTNSSGFQTFNYSGIIETYTVPSGVTSITLTVAGAQGGASSGYTSYTGGLGAIISGTISVTPGQILKILVGEQGGSGNYAGGGGGGSFVTDINNNPLIIAGGGGGTNGPAGFSGSSGLTSTNGGDSYAATGGAAGAGGGGSAGAAGGGGLSGDGGASSCYTPPGAGASFVNGGAGGPAVISGCGPYGGRGGFGGGSAGEWCCTGAAGSGGGYSGGAGATNSSAGTGGGSYNGGTNQNNLSGAQTGNGQIIILYDIFSAKSLSRSPVTISIQDQEINVKRSAVSIAKGTSSATTTDGTHFGNVTLGGANVVRTFTIQNTGTFSLTVDNISVSGVSASAFTLGTLTPASPIASGGSATFTVTFVSSVAGYKFATINITNNDCDEGLYDFAVAGVVSPLAPTPVTATPSSICAGASVDLNATSTGNTINWYTVSVDGTSIGSSASADNFTISPGATATYYAEASDAGTVAATYTFTGAIENYTVPSGITRLTIETWGAQGGTALSTYVGGLGARMKGTFSVTPGQVLKVLVGGKGEDWPGYRAAGGGGGSFVTDINNNPMCIAGGGSGGGGNSAPSNGLPGLTSTDGGNSYFYTGGTAGAGGNAGQGSGGGGGLTGNGVISSCSSIPTSGKSFINGGGGGAGGTCGGGGGAGGFGGGSGGEWCCQGAAGAGGGYSGGAGTDAYGTPGGGGSYNGGDNQSNSSGVQTGNGLVVFSYNAVSSTRQPVTVTIQSQEINVTGKSVSIIKGSTSPQITDGTDFSETLAGANLSNTYTIQNTGITLLTINNIVISGTDASVFSLTGISLPVTIAGSGSKTFTVTFAPTSEGVKNATVTITNDDCDESSYDFAIAGTGRVLGTALDFNGSGNFVGVTSFPGSSEFTIETWVNPRSFGSFNAIMNCDQFNTGAVHFQFASGQLGFSISGNSPQDIVFGSFNTNQYYHIAASYSASNKEVNFYINGSLAYTGSYTTAQSVPSSLGFNIGAWNGNDRFLDGTLDEFRIWNVARTQSEIQAAMNGQYSTTVPGLVAYYKFNQGIANSDNTGLTTALDASGNNLNGTLYNFNLTGTTSNWVVGTVTGILAPSPKINLTGNSSNIISGSSSITTTIGTDFGSTNFGSSLTSIYTIENRGTTVLGISSISITGANASEFTVSVAPAATINSGASTSFTIQFTPASVGTKSAIVNVISSDANNSTYSFAIQAVSVCSIADQSVYSSLTSICGSGSVTITANSQNTIDYYLRDNATNTILAGPVTGTGSLITFAGQSISATSSFNVLATLSGVCSQQMNDVIAVSAFSTPVVTIAGNIIICSGGIASLTASGANSYAWNNGSITGAIDVSPATSTSYSVTGTDLNGCQASSAFAVSVVAQPVVSILGTNTICNGDFTTLTGTGAITYQWSDGSTANPLIISPTVTGIVSVLGIVSAGCQNTSQVNITVNGLPAINISGNTTICSGLTASLTASGANSYAWSNGSVTSAVVVSPTINTIYTVTGTSIQGCLNTNVKTVTVNALPIVTITGTGIICSGDIASLTASGANSYVWNNGSITGAIDVGPATSTSYSVTGTDLNGCQASSAFAVSVVAQPVVSISGINTICSGDFTTLTGTGAITYQWSDGSTANPLIISPTVTGIVSVLGIVSAGCQNTSQVNITVNGLPVINISGNTTICSGLTASLTASGANSYAWSNGSVTSAVVVSPTVNTIYTVTGTSIQGCLNTKVKTVTVNALPIVTVAGTGIICIGGTATITASGANSYAWNNGSITGTINVNPSISTSYSVTGTDLNSCQASSAFAVSVVAQPVVSVSGINTICKGKTTTLTGTGAVTYNWSNGSTVNPLVISPTITGTVSVLGIVSAGCQNTSQFNITVNALPAVNIAGVTTVCSGATALLTVSGANSYIWSNSSVTSAISIFTLVDQNISVAGTDLNGCTNTSQVTVNVLPLPQINATIPGAIAYRTAYVANLSSVAGSKFTLTSGALPAGIKLNSVTGIISGTPTVTGLSTFQVMADNGLCTQVKSYSINVTKINLLVGVKDTSIYFGQPIPVAYTTSIVGLLNGDNLNLSFINSATNASAAGIYPINVLVTGASLSNYNLTTLAGALTILPKMSVTIAGKNLSKTYGQSNTISGIVYFNNQTVTGVNGANTLLGNDFVNLDFVCSATNASGVGTYVITPVTLTGGSGLYKYDFTFLTGKLSIKPARLTIRAFDYTVIAGQDIPTTFPGTVTGLIAGDSITVVNTSDINTSTVLGTYLITPEVSGEGLSNYSLIMFPGNLYVKYGLTITASNLSKIYGEPVSPFTGTVSGLHPGDTLVKITYLSSALANAGAGSYTIIPAISGADIDKYALTTIAGSFVVYPAGLTIAAHNLTRKAKNPNPVFTSSVNGLINGEAININYYTTADTSSLPGTYPILPLPTGIALANYAVTTIAGELTVVSTTSPMNIRLRTFTKVYGKPNPVFAGTETITGKTIGDDVQLTYYYNSSLDTVGVYPLLVSVSGADAGKYVINIQQGSFTITKAPLLVVANSYSRTYGNVNPAMSGTITGLVSGDIIASSYLTDATLASDASEYPVVPYLSGADILRNYAITTVEGTLTIGKAVLTVVGASATKVYNDRNPNFAYNIFGFVNGDNIQALNQVPLSLTEATSFSNAGIYTISFTGANDNNYDFNYINSTLTVIPANQTIVGFTTNQIKVRTGESITLTGYATSGLPLTIQSDDSNIIFINDKVVYGLADGVTHLNISQSGNGNYNATSPILIEAISTSTGIISVDVLGVLGPQTVSTGGKAVTYSMPLKAGYTYLWSYTGKNIQWLSDTTSYQVQVIFTDQTTEGQVIGQMFDSNGSLIKKDGFDVVINNSPEAQLAQTLAENECPPLVTDCKTSYISSFNFGKLVNKTNGCSSAGYGDFTAIGKVDTLLMGNSYHLIAKGFVQGIKSIYFAVWIDYANDGSFSETDDFISASFDADTIFEIKNVVIRNNDLYKGARRMRVGMRTSGAFTKTDACMVEGISGEMEDYLVFIRPQDALEAPDIITPNEDGKNDLFIIRGINPKLDNRLTILDRWGKKKFEQESYDNTWAGTDMNGNKLDDGTYFYSFTNGNTTIRGYVDVKTK